jgi:hypothetical protein
MARLESLNVVADDPKRDSTSPAIPPIDARFARHDCLHGQGIEKVASVGLISAVEWKE